MLGAETDTPGTETDTLGTETETLGTDAGGRLGTLGSVTGGPVGGVGGGGVSSTGGAVGVGVGAGPCAEELLVGGATGVAVTATGSRVPASPPPAEVSGVLDFGFLVTGVLRVVGAEMCTVLGLRRCWS